MKRFRGFDYTFCIGKQCDLKNKCMRYVKHYEIPDWIMVSITDNNSKECDLYINNEEDGCNENRGQ